jgi:hypothetical protein
LYFEGEKIPQIFRILIESEVAMDTSDFDVNQLVPVLHALHVCCHQIMFETEDNLIQIKRQSN